MPVAVPAAETDLVTARGFTADTVTLQGLFKYRNEMLDPKKDAHTTPGTFSPLCGFTGQLVLRGGGCHVGFGWYNAVEKPTAPPAANEIYELVPAKLPLCATPIDMTMACDDTEFCPLASYNTTQMPQHRWNSPTFSADKIRADKRYKGGMIGFAMIGAEQCSQTKFSQAELNAKSKAGAPWITTLVYQSTVDPDSYYLAFEDLPIPPYNGSQPIATWTDSSNHCDGDFNDFVYYVTGVTCKGGGMPCNSGMPGICADGVTQCANGGTDVSCKPLVKPREEICNGIDDNCDGVVDEAPCPGQQVCDKGVCVNKCNDSEFPCVVGLTCDNGLCVDPACVGVSCKAGQICVDGACQGGCEGVVCPHGQVCRVGRCVSSCEGVTCQGNQVCENGACVPSCECRGCTATQTCTNGRCLDKGCDTQTCKPPATVCVAGACQDGCMGVTCPAGQACMAGACVDVERPKGTGGNAGLLDAGATGGSSATGGAKATGGASGTGGAAAGSGAGGEIAPPDKISTCACETSAPPEDWALGLALAGVIGALRLRRRARPQA